ncbi:MAG: aminoacyl-tRNA hydrolase, partial [Chloroflexi bacterium]|nr:aminoacyl-tRNA hydrolase [Chloroflexota bacterium]
MKLIVGLGNPGRVYAESRHNLGFRCVSLFGREHGIEFTKRQSKARIGFGEVGGGKVILAKPQTYMNLSGEAVAPLMRYYQLDPADLLVIYDDVDLPLGNIRIRERGGPAGHNGMKSIIHFLGTQEFPRLRVGIGPMEPEGVEDSSQPTRTPDYVLGNFSAEEKALVSEVCPRVAEAIHCILTEGIGVAMNRYN